MQPASPTPAHLPIPQISALQSSFILPSTHPSTIHLLFHPFAHPPTQVVMNVPEDRYSCLSVCFRTTGCACLLVCFAPVGKLANPLRLHCSSGQIPIVIINNYLTVRKGWKVAFFCRPLYLVWTWHLENNWRQHLDVHSDMMCMRSFGLRAILQ